jgi:uncharacterized protein
MLIAAGAPVDAVSWQLVGETTALMDSYSPGHTELTEFLLQQGANPCVQVQPSRHTALHQAAFVGSLDKCRVLVNSDKHVLHVKDAQGQTALLAAATRGQHQAVKLLHELGGDLMTRDTTRLAALQHCARSGHVPLIKYLLCNGADVNDNVEMGYTPLFAAASTGSTQAMQVLIDNGADVSLKCSDGVTATADVTAMPVAAERGHVAALQLLVSHGADCDVVDSRGTSPLMAASAMGHSAAVQYLLSQGADIHRLNVEHCDALRHAATHSKSPRTVELLLANGARVDVPSVNSSTALSATATNGDAASAAVLLAAGADATRARDDGITCLHCAVMDSHASCVKLLLEHGANAVIA